MTRYKTHRFHEYGEDDEGLRQYYQINDWSAFAQSERDDATIRVGMTFEDVRSIADLSAGGARITPTLAQHFGIIPTLGDLGHQYGYEHVGLLAETLPKQEVFDLYVCTETLEHLREPDENLALIRQHCKRLLLTTPTAEKPETVSHGHLWTWEREDVEEMLAAAGFTPTYFEQVSIFGIWKCE